MDMNSLSTKEPNNLKDEFDEIDDIYSYKDFSMEVRDTKPSFMDIDSKSHLRNKIETDDSSPDNHILDQSICLSYDNQWNTTKENNIIIPKSQNNVSKSFLPFPCVCGPLLNSTIDEVQKINPVACSSPNIDFDPNFNHRFWNTKDVDVLNLSIILKDDMARAIYNRGLSDGTEMASRNEVNTKDASRKRSLTLIRNHILKRRKIRSESYLKANHIKKKLEIKNTPKVVSIVKANDTCQQFSIFDNIDESYLPLPAMQLMLNTALSNENNALLKVYDNDQVIKDDKKKNKRSKSFIKNARTYQICKKNIKLTPIIPLSVLYYMDELKSIKYVNNIDINEA